MSLALRVSLVTGTNKGISFTNEHNLCQQFSGDWCSRHLVLTARDKARGQAAVQQLQAEGLSPRFHLMDTSDIQSIQVLRDFLRKEYGGLDVLVNNEGIAFKAADPTPLHIPAEVTMKTNFFGTRAVCTELLPLMKAQGEPHQGPKLWCFWHDLPLPLCPIYRLRPLSLLSLTGLIAVSPPGQ
ncbi:LOW QUALITY PROTEIN: carbonyl reductase [NADPH] 1-like, partial [Ursus americanus]|uniref:LOW QUALITY PROTEIN: carbonyl reductase [NADPH] 1-like n=1 Tax=Ursus americanus TaxID=9643 RepID=UPI001E679333